jgi:acyl carrier protein
MVANYQTWPKAGCRARLAALSGKAYQQKGAILANHPDSKQRAKAEKSVRAVLRDVLGISAERVADFTDDTELFGALPELDSMAVAGLLTELEDRLDIIIDDDDVDADIFENLGALVDFAAAKLGE